MSDYMSERTRIINQEKKKFLGEQLELNISESKLNDFIIQTKIEELKASYEDSVKFLPKQHFFRAKHKIEESEIFKILKNLPKGHSLHSHLLASASIDFVIKNITYKENAYGKYINDRFKVKFMKPDESLKEQWTSLKELREKDANFDIFLKNQFSLVVENPDKSYDSIESVWIKFKKTFNAVYDMLSYKPAFEEYYYQCLKELYQDNVTYGEFRGTPMPLYDLEGKEYKIEDFFKTMLDVEEKFKQDHKDFFGARYIHSVYRGVTTDELKKDLMNILEMKKKFPKLIVGLDFVGFEEEGHGLIDFYKELLGVAESLHFFFHAGETNWYGHTDVNLVDAILLKSRRIGHAFALNRHPVLMDQLIQQDIAIEHCPISNQVLLLCNDPRNHPVVALMAKGFPIVICNDDPSIWDANGLSYDWYVTFMANTPRDCGLKFLKQVALNSLRYSAMDQEDRDKAMELWTKKWNTFVSEIIKTI